MRRSSFCSAFIVFVESKDPDSVNFRRVLDEENTIPVKEYVAFRISPSSESYKHFRAIYHEVPVPCLMIIGADGEPIRTLSSCYPKEDFLASIKEALEIHKIDLANRRLSDEQQENTMVQILLKLPRGETAVVEFSETSALREVKTFVRESLQVKGPFQMINPYPRKIFTAAEEDSSLLELQLNPTSTILVVPVERRSVWVPPFVSKVAGLLCLLVGRFYSTVTEWFGNLVPRSRR